jgi:hypothetical protein
MRTSRHFARVKARKRSQDDALVNSARASARAAIASCVVAVLAVVVAGAGVLVSLLQWDTYRTSNRINQLSLITSQRAFVYFAPISVRVDNKIWSITMDFGNSGNTPARKLTYRMGCSETGWDESLLKSKMNGPINLGPKVVLNPAACSFQQDQLNAITQGHKSIYVFGQIEYRDMIDSASNHRTEQCMQFLPLNMDVSAFAAQSVPCPKHNCADDECG